MFRVLRRWPGAAIFLWAGWLSAQAPEPAKLKTATVQWVADTPQLTYDVRYSGDGTTMPTAFKYLLKDLAELEGWYLTGEDKSKTIASQAKRIQLEYTQAKSKVKGPRVSKIDVKETPKSIDFVVAFAKKPSRDEVAKLGDVLETFSRKYAKIPKGTAADVELADTPKATVWKLEVRYKAPPAMDKK